MFWCTILLNIFTSYGVIIYNYFGQYVFIEKSNFLNKTRLSLSFFFSTILILNHWFFLKNEKFWRQKQEKGHVFAST